MSLMSFRVNLHSIVYLNVKELLEAGTTSEVYVKATGFEPTNTRFVN